MKKFIYLGKLLGLALLISSCGSNDAVKQNEEKIEEEKVTTVKVEPIRIQKLPVSLEYTANLKAFKEVHYAPASPGRINKIFVNIGDHVKKGQTLAEMDKTQMQQAATQLSNAKSNFKRIDTLYKTGSISEQQYEQVKTQYELALSNLNFLRENTTLECPVNGVITNKYYEAGEFYSGGPNPQTGKAAILTVMQINPLKAYVNIAQSYFPEIKKGMKATITTDIYPDSVFEGSIYRVHPTIEASTRSFLTEVSIQNTKELLRPGMFAEISLRLGDNEALVVPAIAVLKQEGTNNRYVFINENNEAKQVDVKLGRRFDDKIEVISTEINPGDQLIVAGQAALMNGSHIKVVE
jgi:RND family efflux transporter MFP subunit